MEEKIIPPPSLIINRAGRNGLWLGAYLSALAVGTGLSAGIPLMSFAVWALTLYLPFYTYRLIVRGYAASDFRSRFVDLWAEGIVSFLLGSLFQALVVYVGLRFVAPGFIATQVNTAIEILRAAAEPSAMAMADNIEEIIATTGLPKAVDVTVQLIAFDIITGFVLSLIATPIAMTAYSSPEKRRRYLESRQSKKS